MISVTSNIQNEEETYISSIKDYKHEIMAIRRKKHSYLSNQV